jgi:hypothetical protein
MGRLAEIDAEMHELPDFEKGIQFERERILNILSNKGLELEKDVSWDDEASHIRYVFMIDILELLRGYR